MKTNTEFTAKIRKRVAYDALTSTFTWKPRPVSDFLGQKYPAWRTHKIWTKRFDGKPAFRKENKSGHLAGSIDGFAAYAHHLVWFFETGEWPTKPINHIDGNPRNNSFVNLRMVSQTLVTRNQSMNTRNTSGVVGVYFRKETRKWVARIGARDSMQALGSFELFEDAVKARKIAESKGGYHPNHGNRPSRTELSK
jgi:hypothetical protein|tara:strand:+ start:285 stop:869 length:585 start_codon:yes stop_codon:yes gene_type:complete